MGAACAPAERDVSAKGTHFGLSVSLRWSEEEFFEFEVL
jgi:hypothetical protein